MFTCFSVRVRNLPFSNTKAELPLTGVLGVIMMSSTFFHYFQNHIEHTRMNIFSKNLQWGLPYFMVIFWVRLLRVCMNHRIEWAKYIASKSIWIEKKDSTWPQYMVELEAYLSFQTLRGVENLLFSSFPGAGTVPTEHVLQLHSMLESRLAPQLPRVAHRACANEGRTRVGARPLSPCRATRGAVALGSG